MDIYSSPPSVFLEEECTERKKETACRKKRQWRRMGKSSDERRQLPIRHHRHFTDDQMETQQPARMGFLFVCIFFILFYFSHIHFFQITFRKSLPLPCASNFPPSPISIATSSSQHPFFIRNSPDRHRHSQRPFLLQKATNRRG